MRLLESLLDMRSAEASSSVARAQRGAGLTEYAILVACISLIAMMGVKAVGTATDGERNVNFKETPRTK